MKVGIFISEEKFQDLDKLNLEELDKYPGVEIFGRFLGKGERPIAVGAANLFTGIFSAGGKLFLTDKNLYFSAHALNVGRKECKIDLKDITDVKIALNLLISQHLVVKTNADSYRFVVWHGKDWLAKIQDAVTAIKDEKTFLQQ